MHSDVSIIKDRLDVADVISAYIKIEKSGINWKAKCPFHNEKTPSFFISTARQTFYCFGCGEKGDIFTFVEKFEGVDFRGALKILADKAGVELSKNLVSTKDDSLDKMLDLMEESTLFYQNNLSKNLEAQEYLKKRGISFDSVKKWRIGFAIDEWRNLHDYILSKNFSVNDLLETGMVKKALDQNEKTQKVYDTFRGRIMFPIMDTANRTIAFSGRALKKDDKVPKYLNSPETKLFFKSEVLYGFNIAKEHIRKLGYTVLVEGQMDLIMSHQAGILNTVASSGTALTELHLKRILKLSNKMIIGYDGDQAGVKACFRASIMALSLGMEVKIVEIDENEDPALIVFKDPNIWRDAVKNAKHIIDAYIEKAFLDRDDRKINLSVSNNVLPLLSVLKSDIEKARFVKKIASKMSISEEFIWSDLKKIKIDENGGDSFVIENIKTDKNIFDLDKLLVSFIFLKESHKVSDHNVKDMWQKIVGKEYVAKKIEEYCQYKEALIFEAESYIGESTFDNILLDVLCRVESNHLKNRLKIIVKNMDILKDKIEIEKNNEELLNIQKRLRELG